MNIDVEVGRILVQADRYTAVFIPNSLTEVLEAVKLPQYRYMLYAKRRWQPERGATAEYAPGEAFSRGPPPHLSSGYGDGCKRYHI